MRVDVLLGLQWGDEGKGKIVDVLTPKYDIISRFQGGPNAGHTLKFNNVKHVLHTIPSGIFREGIINVIGNGVVIDPIIFKKEIDNIEKQGVDITKTLYVSRKAHLIMPTHKMLDAANEISKGKDKIGSTLKGIGPTYKDKIGRDGLRVGDIERDLESSYNCRVNRHKETLDKLYSFDYQETLEKIEAEWFEAIETIKRFTIIDSDHYINDMLDAGKSVLAEGAQGTLLDIDFGSYPFVTSSNTVSAGACTGMGIAPNKIENIFGIFKAYCTRVGAGPFPTELFDEDGTTLAKIGAEFGSTTGRARRCGWLDMVALKYAIKINGVTELIMMKSDVLDTFETIKVAVEYKIDGVATDKFPYEIDEDTDVVYKEFPGWNVDTTSYTSKEELPENLNRYIKYIEEETGVKISIVSVGPGREQTISL